jgi:hypothetical protein
MDNFTLGIFKASRLSFLVDMMLAHSGADKYALLEDSPFVTLSKMFII